MAAKQSNLEGSLQLECTVLQLKLKDEALFPIKQKFLITTALVERIHQQLEWCQSTLMHLDHGALELSYQNRWLQLPWLSEWSIINIMAKEMVPIVASCAFWGPLIQHKSVEFHCDNLGLVADIIKGSSLDETVIHQIRCLVLTPDLLLLSTLCFYTQKSIMYAMLGI